MGPFDHHGCEHGPALQAIQADLALIVARLTSIEQTQEKIAMSQSDIDAATAQENAEIADLGEKDTAILAAQQEFSAALAAVQTANPTLDTSALVTATANLLTASGADDATVAALTAAAAAPPAAAPPAGTSN